MTESFYQKLFNESPVSIWIEDFSGICRYLDKLKEAKVHDIRAYFTTYPEKLRECLTELKVIDVNQTTLKMYRAENKEHLLDNLPVIFGPEAAPCLLESASPSAKG